jgi:hypothetical protein
MNTATRHRVGDTWNWLALGLAVLALSVRHQTWWSVAATAAAGVLGGLFLTTHESQAAHATVVADARPGGSGAQTPRGRRKRSPARTRALGTTLAIGAAAVVAVRLLWPSLPATHGALWVLVLAAVAEELLFRGALFARLQRWGPGVAIAITSVLFALVHVRAYGWGVVPVDVAAGVLFGWQRWASGTWTVPALTHVLANLVQVT